MAKDRLPDKLAVILHADVADSTQLVQQDEHLAHERIQDSFRRFSEIIEKYRGNVLELRGDALLAEFERASDAVSATLAFQADQATYLSRLEGNLKPGIRAGIAMGEVVLGDNTVTGAGVVLAQRVEQLADPGGLCVTAAVHEALPNRLPLDLKSLGERVLKGFADPVRVYRVELSTAASIPPPQKERQPPSSKINGRAKASIAAILLAVVALSTYLLLQPRFEPEIPLPDGPSIAVLPFTNMSTDAEQDYFVDGLTNDLITDLSRVPGIFVIAHNTMFAYKDKEVNIEEVALQLGVRYVMAGSVERVGNRVRINAHLTDATTGGHEWAERHDGMLDDVFSMRDEINRKIVTSLSLKLVGQPSGEIEIPEAYDAFLRAWDHFRLHTPEAYARAIPYLENAIELAPGYARAHATLAAIYSTIYSVGWADRSGVSYDEAFKQVNRHLDEAMKNPTPLAHRAAARMHEYFGRLDEAMIEAQKAIDLDPNDPSGYEAMSSLLVNLDRAAESLEHVKKAMRLDPQFDYLYRLGSAQFHLERYDEAAKTLLRASKRNPRFDPIYLLLAASYAHLGREQEAKAAYTTFNELYHDPADLQRPLTLAELTEYHKNEAGLKRLRDGLRRVGMPEGDTGEPEHLKFMQLVSVSAGTFDVQGAIKIGAAEARALQDRGAAFFDSRGKSRYESGHIPAAANLLFHKVWGSLEEVADKDAELVFYCDDPECHLAAHSSAQALILGFTQVYYFAGGFTAWENAGYPVEGS